MIFRGMKLKMNFHLEPLDGLHMEDYDFDCTFFVYTNKTVVKPKSSMTRVDRDNYIVKLEAEDIKALGKGEIKVMVTAYIPDGDFSDGIRIEKLLLCSEIVVM